VTIEDVKDYLRKAPHNFDSRNSDSARQLLASLKAKAVDANDQAEAKWIWCLEQIVEIQDKYIEAFHKLKTDKFYEAWCSFERVELELLFLSWHFQDPDGEFHVPFIARHTSRYQSIFPYKLFMSPELLEEEKTCTICNQVISIRNPCGHRVGEIYNGEMCSRRVTKAKILGMAIVHNPVQKYSVPFLSESSGDGKKDHYNYSVVKYLIQRLESPFHEWEVEWTKRRHPHSRFSHIGRNDPCPCESGKKYKKCCLLEEGVLRPHCQFIFHVSPPEHLLTVEYSD
jgi:hypothetical protein